MKTSPTAAESAAFMTRKPSIAASRPRIGSTSHDDDVGAHAVRPRRDAAPDPAVATDDHGLAGEQDVRGAQDAVDRALTGAVAVVEQVLGERLVHGHHRVAQLAGVGHGAKPDDAGRGLLRPADHLVEQLGAIRVQLVHEIGAVVHGDMRTMVEGRADVRVVGVAVLALDGVHGDAVVDHQRGRHVVLRRERVRRAEHDVGAAVAQGAHEVRRLGGDVQAGADAPAGQRPLGARTARGWRPAPASAGPPIRSSGVRHRPGRCPRRRPPSFRFAWPRKSHCLSYRSHEPPATGASTGEALDEVAVGSIAEAVRRPPRRDHCRRGR